MMRSERSMMRSSSPELRLILLIYLVRLLMVFLKLPWSIISKIRLIGFSITNELRLTCGSSVCTSWVTVGTAFFGCSITTDLSSGTVARGLMSKEGVILLMILLCSSTDLLFWLGLGTSIGVFL